MGQTSRRDRNKPRKNHIVAIHWSGNSLVPGSLSTPGGGQLGHHAQTGVEPVPARHSSRQGLPRTRKNGAWKSDYLLDPPDCSQSANFGTLVLRNMLLPSNLWPILVSCILLA
jgi:hypothetical protein